MAIATYEADDRVSLKASIHGVISRQNASFLRDQVSSAVRGAGNFANKYLTKALEYAESFDYDRLMDKVSAIKDRWSKRWDEDRIETLPTLADYQQAKSKMRRWIMADTRVRELYHSDKVSGYEGKFYGAGDTHVGRELDDWRNVNQGRYVGTEDEDRFVTHVDMLVVDGEGEESIRLTHSQRVIIRDVQALLHLELDEGGEDPTSFMRHLL